MESKVHFTHYFDRQVTFFDVIKNEVEGKFWTQFFSGYMKWHRKFCSQYFQNILNGHEGLEWKAVEDSGKHPS